MLPRPGVFIRPTWTPGLVAILQARVNGCLAAASGRQLRSTGKHVLILHQRQFEGAASCPSGSLLGWAHLRVFRATNRSHPATTGATVSAIGWYRRLFQSDLQTHCLLPFVGHRGTGAATTTLAARHVHAPCDPKRGVRHGWRDEIVVPLRQINDGVGFFKMKDRGLSGFPMGP